MDTDKYPRVFVIAAFLVAVVAGLYTLLLVYKPLIRPVVAVSPPFLIAIALALLLDPLIDRFERRGVSRGMAVGIVGLAFVVAFLLVGFLLVPKMAQQAGSLAANFEDYLNQAQDRINEVLERNKPLLQRLHLPTTLGEWSDRYSQQLENVASGSLSFLADLLTSMLSRIIWLIIIPLATLWLLRDIDYIKAKIVHFTPERHRDRVIQLSTAVGVVFGKYVRGMLTVALLFSLVAMLILSLAGLDYGLVIGLVSGLFYLVPYVGVLIIAVVTGLAALVQPGGTTGYAILLMGILVVQSYVVFDLLVTPRVVGGSVGVHPVIALFSLLLGAQMAGVVGMVLAVPVAASIQVGLGQFWPKILDKVQPVPRRGTGPPEQPRPE